MSIELLLTSVASLCQATMLIGFGNFEFSCSLKKHTAMPSIIQLAYH